MSVTGVVGLDVCSTVVVGCPNAVGTFVVVETTSLLVKSVVETSKTCPDIVVGSTVEVVSLG